YRNSAGEQPTFDYDFENGTRRAAREDGARAHWLTDVRGYLLEGRSLQAVCHQNADYSSRSAE
ncbi:hypothetical protein, partial [Erwinia tasmaniensis]|uniref:hypothetical protein n=1 Tax=Erwinia tasmaniensis TaxID=338565 RepID=UPI003A4DD3C4